MESFNEAWELVKNYCKEQITDVAFRTWFIKIEPLSLDFEKGEATIEVPNDFHKQTLTRCYTQLLTDAFKSVFGQEIKYKIAVKNPTYAPQKPVAAGDYYDLTFDTFIVGPSNNFAHAACVAVANKPAMIYNPLFIYGNPGLGKTHLLKAISRDVSEHYPELNIVYVKGDEFTNELIEAIQKGTTPAFREKYRKADLLLVDDIQFIGGKESTQEEFFHTFNTLYESRKQIILTSDRPPKDIATLEERLRNRFEWGLTADIAVPEFETRIAIIRRKAEMLEIELSDTVCEFIANKVKSNIRSLEGIVKKMRAYLILENRMPSIATAQNAISDISKDEEPTPITIDKILEEVSRTYGCTKEDILSKKRGKISKARQIAAYIIRDITQMPMGNIGEILGDRDHSTIVYSISQVEEKKKNDPSVRSTVEDIIKNIKNR